MRAALLIPPPSYRVHREPYHAQRAAADHVEPAARGPDHHVHALAQSADVFDKKLIYDALKKFGYDDFRPGQEEGILRILRGTHHDIILPEMLVLFNLGFIMSITTIS